MTLLLLTGQLPTTEDQQSCPCDSTQLHLSVQMIKASACILLGTGNQCQPEAASPQQSHTALWAASVLVDVPRIEEVRQPELELVRLDWKMPLSTETSRGAQPLDSPGMQSVPPWSRSLLALSQQATPPLTPHFPSSTGTLHFFLLCPFLEALGEAPVLSREAERDGTKGRGREMGCYEYR